MKIVSTVVDLRALRGQSSESVGMVPTMGYLHAGHESLIARARAECGQVIVSIFVNPTQFGPHEDLDRYPRDVPRDLALCEQHGVDVVFVPTVAEMYPPGSNTTVDVEGLTTRWEGASRPGHFRGVATVVTKLFRAALPDRAYFGEKDYQQLQVVRRLATDLLLDVEVIGCPTVREADGLALSSRNVYLGPAARDRALALSRALFAARTAHAAGEQDGTRLVAMMRSVASPALEIDYAAVVDADTLEPLATVPHGGRALIAGWIDGVHLIDNLALDLAFG